jgi:NAD(P)-dependent dehydrogenase (short-subunit alcohol dehydrogenase family)
LTYLNSLRLDGKVALVIGCGGGGMGTHTSLALAEAGATVLAVDVFEEQVKDTEEQIAAIGGKCVGFTADARDVAAITEIVEMGWSEFGAVHHLANVVGGSRIGEFFRTEEYPEDVFDRVVEFNLRTHFVACREVARRLIASGTPGSIVNFSSLAGNYTLPYQVAYGAAKAAVINMTRTMAVEWGPHAIRVNAIAPGGGIETPRVMGRGDAPDDDIYDPIRWNPLGRKLKPDEVGSVALFLLSDLASAITGQTLTVDAGVSSRMPSGGLERWAAMLPK